MKTMISSLCVAALLCSAACADSDATQQPEPKPSSAAKTSVESFDGLIVPSHATIMRAPENSFRVAGWNSSGDWIKLMNLVEDGKEVKAGEVIGWFEFPGKRAESFLQDILSRARADEESSRLGVTEELAKMRSSKAQLELSAERALLDTKKEGVIAERDLDRLKIEAKQAEFEHQAQDKRLGAYQRSQRANDAYMERRVKGGEANMERYRKYKDRFEVKAPHDGVARHSFFRRRGRKVQKGDGMPSGMEFMTVARDASLEIVFYIPEQRYPLTKVQREFIVQSPSSSQTYKVKVKRIEAIPQELGFLKGDDNLPTAREKMYVVHADFLAPPEELSAGLEVKVRLP